VFGWFIFYVELGFLFLKLLRLHARPELPEFAVLSQAASLAILGYVLHATRRVQALLDAVRGGWRFNRIGANVAETEELPPAVRRQALAYKKILFIATLLIILVAALCWALFTSYEVMKLVLLVAVPAMAAVLLVILVREETAIEEVSSALSVNPHASD
jgi:peptidoglycan/LPS O-acetylase OafA/YrhL